MTASAPGTGVAVRRAMNTLQTPYRDDAVAAEIRYEDLFSRKLKELRSATIPARIQERRNGRIAAGSVGIAGVVLMIVVGVTHIASHSHPRGVVSGILFGSWAAMALAYIIARAGTRLWLDLRALPSRSSDRRADVARLEATSIPGDLCEEVYQSEQSSIALPMIAISLLAPLTVHGLAFVGFLAGVNNVDAWGKFDGWIGLSAVIVGHAHIVLAYLCYRFAKKMRELPAEEVDDAGRKLGWNAFWWTVTASAIPSGVLYLIPPVVTLVTGLVFCPLMFAVMRKRILEERRALDAALAGAAPS
jgi:hypothetical protein